MKDLMQLAQDCWNIGVEQVGAGEYGLAELYFQKGQLYKQNNKKIEQTYVQFCKDQELAAEPFLKDIYRRIEVNKDGTDFIQLQEYYQQRKKMLHYLQEPSSFGTTGNRADRFIDHCFADLQEDCKNKQKLMDFYEAVCCAPAVDIIALLNKLYDKDIDAGFLADTLHECYAGKVYLYYASRSDRGIDRAIALSATGKRDEACRFLVDELHRIERLLFFLAGNCGLGLLEFELESLPKKLQEAWRELRRLRMRHERLSNLRVQAVSPLVSIMIPTYNMPEIFERTMRSAARQNYKNLEIIVCDNSTNDETEILMERYHTDTRVRYFHNRTAKTKADNFRPFEQLAQGEYLQWLMHDDILLPDKVKKMADCLSRMPEVTLVASQRGVIDREGNFQKSWLQTNLPIKGDAAVFSGEEIGKLFFQRVGNVLGEPASVLFRRKDLKHHYWNADSKGYKTISDVVMWLELLEKGQCVLFRDSLSYFRFFAEQEGQQPDVILLSRIEWFQLASEYYHRHLFIDQLDYLHVLNVLVKENNRLSRKLNIGKLFVKEEIWQEYTACVEQAKKILSQAEDE